MPKYIVTAKEICHSYHRVEANSPAEAIRLIAEEIDTPNVIHMGDEYSYMLDPDTWTVEVDE